ncbi:MAG: c-type cytochrome [Thermoanaerobaculia bacterium]
MLRKIGKVFVIGSAIVAGLLLVLSGVIVARADRKFDAPYPNITASKDPRVIETGRYIAYGPGHCVSCHTDASQHEAVRRGEMPPLTGANEFKLPFGVVYTPNLTPDPETGIGKRTPQELARFIRYGIHHDNRAAMPFMDFHELSDSDLQAIVSFLLSQQPVRKEIPKNQLNLVGKGLLAFVIKPIGPSAMPPHESPASGATVERGRYLANNVAVCATCHTKRSPLDGSYLNAKFSGGNTMPSDEDGTKMFVTPNLTPDPQTGRIASWSEEQFVGRFQAGVGQPGSHMPWRSYQRMSTEDLQAIYRYLKTLPPVVNNTGPLLQARTAHR